MTILSNEEKLAIAQQHKRNLEYNKYNLDLTLIEENAVSSPKADVIASLTTEINELTNKITAIDAEISSLTE